MDDAIETFRKARKIAPHAGVVKCDEEELFKGVREVKEATSMVA